jgi:asparagine synthetase B (glutamine-hydrolysing)
MCGIFGLVGEGKPEFEEPLPMGTPAMPHRGPDDEGIELFLLASDPYSCVGSPRGLELAGGVHEPRGGLGETWWT